MEAEMITTGTRYVCRIWTKTETVQHIHVKFMNISFRGILYEVLELMCVSRYTDGDKGADRCW
jgi:hypothetical protein